MLANAKQHVFSTVIIETYKKQLSLTFIKETDKKKLILFVMKLTSHLFCSVNVTGKEPIISYHHRVATGGAAMSGQGIAAI